MEYSKNVFLIFAIMQKINTIGIIGGGQLGKMLIEEGIRYNVRFATLDPDANSPAMPISNLHITGSLQDADKINELASHADVLTYEIEHINIDALFALETAGKLLIPSPRILQIVQDKGLQKQFYVDNDIPTAPFVIVNNASEWKNAIVKSGFTKFAAKLCKGGYDGKGVVLLCAADILENTIDIPFDAPTVLEAFVENDKEISIIVARGLDGEVTCFDAVEMEFDAVANLVTYLKCPATILESVHQKAKIIATALIEKMNGVGIFAIEMFVTPAGEIIVNEMAPRPHNSGHHSIEACYTSQYEQLIRVLLGKPLGDTSIIEPSAMMNILGAATVSGAYKLKHETELLKMQGVYIHDYGKAESKPMRKLGHVTVMAKTEEDLKKKAEKVMGMLEVVGRG
jgi:5-(carboxyamino)imidazole ribonucleotide synthase